MTMDFLLTGLLQSLILALVAYAIMIPFRLLNFPDLTAEGAYPLGGAVCTSLLLLHVNPLLAVIISSLVTGLMGVATSLIHLRLKVNTLLAGIILSTMMYSVNLRLMGKPNIALFNTASLFSQSSALINILFLLTILTALVLPLALFLRTEIGLRLRAVGLNQAFARRQSISVACYTVLGLFIAGCFTGVAGGLIVQLQYYMDVGMGIGIVIHGLAALMIGEAIIGNNTINRQLIAPLIGALVYQQIQGLVLFIGLAPSDLKFFTGSLVLLVIGLQRGAQHENH
ncbi:MAG: ABC transporter permease [Legionella sp.]|nr:MAG: ABC transporter permease [Legionella sp.]